MGTELEELAEALYETAIAATPIEHILHPVQQVLAKARMVKVLDRAFNPKGRAPKPFVLDREMVRGSLQELATHVNDKYCLPGWCFAVMLFETGGPGKNMQWVSNAQREDMIKSLREFATNLEKRKAGGPGDDPESVL